MVHSRDFSPSALCPVKAAQESKEWLPALPPALQGQPDLVCGLEENGVAGYR